LSVADTPAGAAVTANEIFYELNVDET
jgi:hypothetical protein